MHRTNKKSSANLYFYCESQDFLSGDAISTNKMLWCFMAFCVHVGYFLDILTVWFRGCNISDVGLSGCLHISPDGNISASVGYRRLFLVTLGIL